MKNFLKFICLALISALAWTGCSNMASSGSSNNNSLLLSMLNSGSTARSAAMKEITLVATGDSELVHFSSGNSLGSIIADSFTAADLKYYLFYQNKVNTADKTTTAVPLTFTASAGNPNIGTVPLNIPDGYYDFTLYATEAEVATATEANVSQKAVLKGVTSADLRTATDTVTFYMTTEGIAGAADISIKLYTIDWECNLSEYTVAASITNKLTGAYVPNNDPTNISDTSGKLPKDAAPATAQYAKTGVTAGTYNFEVAFTNTQTSKTYVYSDTIIVAPNHAIVKEIGIPEIVEHAPDAPSALLVTFKDPDLVDYDNETFNVSFEWTDNSNNESYFQLDILTIADNTLFADINDSTATEWDDSYRTTLGATATSALASYGTGSNDTTDFYGNYTIGYVSGSLRKGNSKAVINLPFGKRYLARICAVNDAGKSDFAYMDLATAPSTYATGYSKFAAATKAINRYRLTYDLQGGTLAPAPSGTAITGKIVEFRTQNEVANATADTYVASKITSNVDVPSADILDPVTDTTTYLSLKRGEKSWTSWRLNSDKGTLYPDASASTDPYDPPDYNGFKDLTLYASYSTASATVNIYDDNEHDITIANIAASGAGVDDSDLATAKTIKYDSTSTGASSILWTVSYTTAQTDAGVKWDKVKYEIKRSGTGTIADSGDMTAGASDFTATTVMTGYGAGTYTITFKAYVSNSSRTQPYTFPVTIQITE